MKFERFTPLLSPLLAKTKAKILAPISIAKRITFGDLQAEPKMNIPDPIKEIVPNI